MGDWLQIKDLFHAALERDPPERSAFLDASCGGDEALRGEVARLLAAHAQAGTFIECPPAAMSIAGRVIGHYEIDRRIGTGGMGEVYLAKDLELGRTVAIKMALGTDADAHARLKREAQHASQLNHPNICTIHEVGTFDGQPFIVMESVEGQHLDDVIPSGGLPAAAVVEYGAQIAAALAHAHATGVIHRDLKGANVMVTGDGRVKVLDFGLARRHSPERVKDLSLSRESLSDQEIAAGTLSSMAPEVLRGSAADGRSDIWALGVLLYEMASGTRPFTGATGFELSGAILHQAPSPLPRHVPPPLSDLILRCLEKDPRARIQQAGEVKSALEAITFHDRPTLSRRGIGVAAAVLLAAVVGAVPFIGRTAPAVPAAPAATGAAAGPRAIAVMNFDNVAGAQDLAWLSKGLPRMLVTGLAQTSGLPVVSGQRLEEAARQIGGTGVDVLSSAEFADVARRSGAGAVVSGTIMRAGDEIRVDVELHDLATGRVVAAESGRGNDVFAIADHLTARIRAAAGFADSGAVKRVADVSSSSLEAYRLYSEGVDACLNMRWSDAYQQLEAAIAIDPTFAEAYLQLAVVASSHGSPIARQEYMRKAAEYADRLGPQQKRFLEIQLVRRTGDPARVARLLDAFLADYPLVEEAYSVATSVYNPLLGGFYDPGKMLAITERGVKALPVSGPARNSYGYGLIGAGRYADALREFQVYARLAPREPNPHDSTGEAYLNLGLADKAIESYARARQVDPTFHQARGGHAFALAALGRYDEAIAIVEQSTTVEKALLLSRAGRYRGAAQVMVAGSRDTAALESFDEGVMRLLAAVLALERGDARRAALEAASAERVFHAGKHPREATYLVMTHLVAGIAALRQGHIAEARARLERQASSARSRFELEVWCRDALEGEIALAAGDARAALLFSRREPKQKFFGFDAIGAALIANHLPSRDGEARAAAARGDLASAIGSYRKLLTFGAGPWVSVLEPRYVLALARLLDKTGDGNAALREYDRFLALWHGADPDLPEPAEARRAIARLRRP
jgi:TolB-like protein/tRNA A-37 threonylcarbamoyl transferase component Bud32/Tfp pilus assembly protein PilF